MGLTISPFDYTIYNESCGFEWETWHRSFELCMEGSNISNDRQKTVLLLHFAGTAAQQLFDSLIDPKVSNECGPLANIEQYIPHKTEYE